MKLFQLDDFKPVFLCKYCWKTDTESEMIYTFATIIENEIISGNDEINTYKFWKLIDIQNNRNKDIFDPNLLHEFDMMLLQDEFFEMLKEKFD